MNSRGASMKLLGEERRRVEQSKLLSQLWGFWRRWEGGGSANVHRRLYAPRIRSRLSHSVIIVAVV